MDILYISARNVLSDGYPYKYYSDLYRELRLSHNVNVHQGSITNINDILNKYDNTDCVIFDLGYFAQKDSNSFNEIVVGSNVSRVVVDIYEFPDLDVIQKNDKLYDRRGQTSVFTEDLKADITYMLDWDDLPEHAHQYIMTRAGRQLQESIIGSTDLGSINLTAESEARSQFLEEETTKSEHNMLRGNPNHTGVFQTYIPSRALIR